ncbi:MAG TPA: peptide chain release factor aRF-1 [Candidatus Nanoarchaeia archaeon]|nr:peptide chain release factor aRF-1 [Candidatus Nanoarchaeia archaeon]
MVTEKVTHFYGCQMATSNSVKQHKLRKLIAWLSGKEGRGMEFISLYLPHETSITDVISILKKESDSCVSKGEGIKDRLQEAFKNVIQRLKMIEKTPENGLAIFAGTLTDDMEDEKLYVEELIPPEPVPTYLLEVDSHFHLEPLREMAKGKKVIGIMAVDTKEASFGIFREEHLELIEKITSGIPGKSGKGGSSQRRYERERDMEVTAFFHRIAEHAARAFLEKNRVTALVVGGPGTTKNDFLKGDFLHYELNNAVLSTVDTQSADEKGVREVLDKSFETLKNMCSPEEKMIVQRLLAEIGKQDGQYVCGLDAVLDALKKGEVEVVIVVDNSDMTDIVATCKKCGLSKADLSFVITKMQTRQKIISTPCERCKSIEYVVEERDIVDVLEDLASQTGARVEVISTESEEKVKLKALGSFAALLRYRPA